ncbi:MAG: putative RNA methyltransferase [Galactobacter sp.]
MDFPELICPVCAGVLTLLRREDGRPAALTCEDGHRYDAARQGHLNLLTGRGSKHVEDTKDMVASRTRWLEAGHYSPIADALGRTVARHGRPAPSAMGELQIVDTGAGTGYYTQQLLDYLSGPDVNVRGTAVDLDLSKAGAQRAARDPRVLSLVWDTWKDWPLAASSADVLLDVFAPRNLAEFARVLRPGGLAVVVVPRPQHLQQLRTSGLLGIDEHKEERLASAFAADFDEIGTDDVESSIELSASSAADLIHMGPAGHHQTWEAIHAGLLREPVPSVDLAVRVHAYRRR